MKNGQQVEVVDFEGKRLVRRVVDMIGDVVLICKPEEYAIAKERRCLPWCVGFKKKYVIEKA